jgi:hypothetical protein
MSATALRVGILSTWNTRCGIAEYSRHLAEAMSRVDGVQVTILGSRNFGDRAIAPHEEWVEPAFDVQIWHPKHKFELDVDRILEKQLDVLHIQYSNLFFGRRHFVELLRRFPGVTALTYHDKGGVIAFPHELVNLLYAHREDVGTGRRRLIPQGIDLRRPVVKTFGLGRSRSDLIAAICERNGWSFEHNFGTENWMTSEELFTWLRDSDAIVLWYDDDRRSGGSAGAPLAIGTRRPVYVNDTEWFRDLPDRTTNLRKLHSPEQLEHALREQLADSYAELRTWDRVADRLLADFREALERTPPELFRHRRGLRERIFVALDHKPLRRALRRAKAVGFG